MPSLCDDDSWIRRNTWSCSYLWQVYLPSLDGLPFFSYTFLTAAGKAAGRLHSPVHCPCPLSSAPRTSIYEYHHNIYRVGSPSHDVSVGKLGSGYEETLGSRLNADRLSGCPKVTEAGKGACPNLSPVRWGQRESVQACLNVSPVECTPVPTDAYVTWFHRAHVEYRRRLG